MSLPHFRGLVDQFEPLASPWASARLPCHRAVSPSILTYEELVLPLVRPPCVPTSFCSCKPKSGICRWTEAARPWLAGPVAAGTGHSHAWPSLVHGAWGFVVAPWSSCYLFAWEFLNSWCMCVCVLNCWGMCSPPDWCKREEEWWMIPCLLGRREKEKVLHDRGMQLMEEMYLILWDGKFLAEKFFKLQWNLPCTGMCGGRGENVTTGSLAIRHDTLHSRMHDSHRVCDRLFCGQVCYRKRDVSSIPEDPTAVTPNQVMMRTGWKKEKSRGQLRCRAFEIIAFVCFVMDRLTPAGAFVQLVLRP